MSKEVCQLGYIYRMNDEVYGCLFVVMAKQMGGKATSVTAMTAMTTQISDCGVCAPRTTCRRFTQFRRAVLDHPASTRLRDRFHFRNNNHKKKNTTTFLESADRKYTKIYHRSIEVYPHAFPFIATIIQSFHHARIQRRSQKTPTKGQPRPGHRRRTRTDRQGQGTTQAIAMYRLSTGNEDYQN